MKRHTCAFHPSHETQTRCEICDRWICSKCEHRVGDHVYCSRWCGVRGTTRSAARAVAAAARLRPSLPWVIAALGLTALAFMAAMAILVARIVLVSGGAPAVSPRAVPVRTPVAVEGRLERDGRGWRIVVSGPPGMTVLVAAGSRPLLVVVLDARGRAVTRRLRLAGSPPRVTLSPLGRASVAMPLAPTPSPTPAPSSTPTPVPSPTPTATPSPTPTATPTATPSPTPSPTATPVPTPTRTPTPTPTAAPTAAPRPRAIRTPIVVRPLRRPASWTGRARPTPTPAPPGRAAVIRPGPTGRARRQTPGQRPSRGPAPPDIGLVGDAGPRLALTFDGGSEADGTAGLLDLLRRMHVRATIFLTGSFIRHHPALVRQAVLDGHEIGNHTFSHPHLTTYAADRRQKLRAGVTKAWFQGQLRAAEDLFFEATGHRMAPLWRAPYGEENRTLRAWAWELGYLHVRWSSLRGASLDSWDWVADEHSRLYEDPDTMMRRLTRFPHLDGGIVLMHLATRRPHPPWKVLPRLLRELDRRGIRQGTVGDLLRASPRWRPWLERAGRRHREVFGL